MPKTNSGPTGPIPAVDVDRKGFDRIDPTNLVGEEEENTENEDGQIAVDSSLQDPLAGSGFDLIGQEGESAEGTDLGVSFDPFTGRDREGVDVGSLFPGEDESENDSGGRGTGPDEPPEGKYGRGMISADGAGPGEGGGAGTTKGIGYGIPTTGEGEVTNSPVTATIGERQGYKAYEDEMTRKADEMHEQRKRQEAASQSSTDNGGSKSGGSGDPEIIHSGFDKDGNPVTTFDDGTIVTVYPDRVETNTKDVTTVRYNDGRVEQMTAEEEAKKKAAAEAARKKAEEEAAKAAEEAAKKAAEEAARKKAEEEAAKKAAEAAGGGTGSSTDVDYVSPEERARFQEELGSLSPGAQKGGAPDDGNIDPTREGNFYVEGSGGQVPDIKERYLGGDNVEPDFGGGGRPPGDPPSPGNTDGNTTPAWDAPANPVGSGPFERNKSREVETETDQQAPPEDSNGATAAAPEVVSGPVRLPLEPDVITDQMTAAGASVTKTWPNDGAFPNDGRTVTWYPDGRVKTEYPDGRVVNESPDGTIRTQHPSGLVETSNPDGTVEREYPQVVSSPGELPIDSDVLKDESDKPRLDRDNPTEVTKGAAETGPVQTTAASSPSPFQPIGSADIPAALAAVEPELTGRQREISEGYYTIDPGETNDGSGTYGPEDTDDYPGRSEEGNDGDDAAGSSDGSEETNDSEGTVTFTDADGTSSDSTGTGTGEDDDESPDLTVGSRDTPVVEESSPDPVIDPPTTDTDSDVSGPEPIDAPEPNYGGGDGFGSVPVVDYQERRPELETVGPVNSDEPDFELKTDDPLEELGG